MKNVEAVEPGLVREKMLGIRMIMREGVSVRDVDVLTYILEADFVLSGALFDYQDSQGGAGTPKLDFSAKRNSFSKTPPLCTCSRRPRQ